MKEKSLKLFLEALNKEIRGAVSDSWRYHKDALKSEDLKKSDIGTLDFGGDEWNDIAFFEGMIYGLEKAKNLLFQLYSDGE